LIHIENESCNRLETIFFYNAKLHILIRYQKCNYCVIIYLADNNIFDIPICEETLNFFDLEFAEESPIQDSNTSSNTSMIFENKITGKNFFFFKYFFAHFKVNI